MFFVLGQWKPNALQHNMMGVCQFNFEMDGVEPQKKDL